MMFAPPWLVLSTALPVVSPPDPSQLSGANVVEPCQWPTVVSYRAGEEKCTGTLVHPEVVVTAAHCITEWSAGQVRFGEFYRPSAFKVDVKFCVANPEFVATRAPSEDYGFCKLKRPIDQIPATPLLMGCETQHLQPGIDVVLVGYGITLDDAFFGTKRYAYSSVDSKLRADGTVWIGDAETNGCFGDSGGPAFLQLPDGSWRTLGVLAFGPECGQGPSLYRTLADQAEWLETEAGVDLTPCHTASGQWDPSPACGGFALNPRDSTAQWVAYCDGARSGIGQACSTDIVEDDNEMANGSSDDEGDQATEMSETDPTAGGATGGCACHLANSPESTALWAWLWVVGGYKRRR